MIETPESRAAAERLKSTRDHLMTMVDEEKQKTERLVEASTNTVQQLALKIGEIEDALKRYEEAGSPTRKPAKRA